MSEITLFFRTVQNKKIVFYPEVLNYNFVCVSAICVMLIISAMRGYVYTNAGRVALIFQQN